MQTTIPDTPRVEPLAQDPRAPHTPVSQRIALTVCALVCVGAGMILAGVGAWQLWVFLLAPDLPLLAGSGRGLQRGQLHPRAVPLYNATHSLVGPALLAVASPWLGIAWAAGALAWAAHVLFDRSLGFGPRDRAGFRRQPAGPTVRQVAAFLVAAMTLAFLGYATWAAVAWSRYGQPGGDAAAATRDPLLDQFIPVYEVAEHHQIRVAAPAEITLAAAREVDLQGSPINQAIVSVRTIPSRLRGEPPRPPSPGLLEETLGLGWGILAEVPGREVVVGAVTQPWEPVVVFRALPPEEFLAFDEPGYAKIVWTLVAEPLGPNESIARTETRVLTTDPESRERFRRYWAIFSPGIVIIRHEALRMVKAEAERRARAAAASGGEER
jgi:hypothetical protein